MNRDELLTAILVGCALTTTSVVVFREFHTASNRPDLILSEKPAYIDGWRDYMAKGVRIGPSNAPVQVIEFVDFECPSCASFLKILKDLRDRYPAQIEISVIHYPLPGHRFAEPAARAAECAGEQGNFEAMHDLLFAEQGQLGLKAWGTFAIEAGVQDYVAFEACMQRRDPVPRVVEGHQLGDQLSIRGTPTVVINGWLLSRPPSLDEFDRMAKLVLAGGVPAF
ncbi:DsbA family protein [Steroidobacter cummioxidans]|uniref:DsbA family protein n=1 Tax=Steroidobacter cummioxidans TaxID=1803913 RepID=UPI000E323682|nr:thioredoxin domain-containing protein [Steroidobacter cummioxidans]